MVPNRATHHNYECENFSVSYLCWNDHILIITVYNLHDCTFNPSVYGGGSDLDFVMSNSKRKTHNQ